MEQMKPMTYKIYVRTDEQSRITAVNSSAFLTETDGWTLIDEGSEWPKYPHAQGNYFEKHIYTTDGIPQYKLAAAGNDYGVDAVERSTEEIEADRAATPPAPPSTEQRVEELEEQLALTDEAAIELYEAQMAQEEINAAQDDALIEIYEMIGG